MTQWWNDDGDSPSAPAGQPSAPESSVRPDNSTVASPQYELPTQPAQSARPDLVARSGANATVVGALSGIVAGLVGVGVGAAIGGSNDVAPGIIVGFVAATLGFLLHGWRDLSAGFVERGLRHGIIGIVVATTAGLIGLAIADGLYFGLRDQPGDVTAERVALVIGWLVIGTLVGIGIGALGGRQRATSGFIGGAVGGLLGGVLFVALDGTREADGAMLVGVLAASTILGVAVGSVERLRKDLWLTVVDGPLAGREFILYGDQIRIGSDPACDVALPGDPRVHPVHLHLTTGRPLEGQAVGDAPVTIDSARFLHGPISDSAIIHVGSTFLEVHRT